MGGVETSSSRAVNDSYAEERFSLRQSVQRGLYQLQAKEQEQEQEEQEKKKRRREEEKENEKEKE